MSIHLTFQRGLQKPLGQLLQQPTGTQQRHPLTAGLLRQCGHSVIIEDLGRQLLTADRLAGGRIDCHPTLNVRHGHQQIILSV